MIKYAWNVFYFVFVLINDNLEIILNMRERERERERNTAIYFLQDKNQIFQIILM